MFRIYTRIVQTCTTCPQTNADENENIQRGCSQLLTDNNVFLKYHNKTHNIHPVHILAKLRSEAKQRRTSKHYMHMWSEDELSQEMNSLAKHKSSMSFSEAIANRSSAESDQQRYNSLHTSSVSSGISSMMNRISRTITHVCRITPHNVTKYSNTRCTVHITKR